MASGGLQDSGFLEITGTTAKTLKKKSNFKGDIKRPIDPKANKTTDETSNENENGNLQQEVMITIDMMRRHNMENDERKKLVEKASELLSAQSNIIERLEWEIQELKSRIITLRKNENELKEKLINSKKGDKNGSEYDQRGIGKLKEQIDELNDTIAEKDIELHNVKETNLNLWVEFEKLRKNIGILKDDITRKQEEHMEAMETMKREQNKRDEALLEEVKRTQNMVQDISNQMPKNEQGQNQGRGSQQNKPKTSKLSVQNRTSKSGKKPWKDNFKK